MKLSTLFVQSIVILVFLTGVGLLFNKIETTSLSNPFVTNTASMTTETES